MILGLHKTRDLINYALVDRRSKVQRKGNISAEKSALLQTICKQCDIGPGDLESVATRDDQQFKLPDVVSSRKVKPINADLYSVWLSDVGQGVSPGVPEYPYLLWCESEPGSDLYLAESPLRNKRLLSHSEISITELVKRLADELGVMDLFRAARTGDQHYLPLPKGPDTDNLFDLSYLYDEIRRVRKGFRSTQDRELSLELREQLHDYWMSDVAASLQEVIFETIIGKMIHAASDLSVNTLGVVGSLVYNERFLSLLNKYVDKLGYTIRLPLVDLVNDHAASLAGLAYHHQ